MCCRSARLSFSAILERSSTQPDGTGSTHCGSFRRSGCMFSTGGACGLIERLSLEISSRSHSSWSFRPSSSWPRAPWCRAMRRVFLRGTTISSRFAAGTSQLEVSSLYSQVFAHGSFLIQLRRPFRASYSSPVSRASSPPIGGYTRCWWSSLLWAWPVWRTPGSRLGPPNTSPGNLERLARFSPRLLERGALGVRARELYDERDVSRSAAQY